LSQNRHFLNPVFSAKTKKQLRLEMASKHTRQYICTYVMLHLHKLITSNGKSDLKFFLHFLQFECFYLKIDSVVGTVPLEPHPVQHGSNLRATFFKINRLSMYIRLEEAFKNICNLQMLVPNRLNVCTLL
jgi:hypothetical protein